MRRSRLRKALAVSTAVVSPARRDFRIVRIWEVGCEGDDAVAVGAGVGEA